MQESGIYSDLIMRIVTITSLHLNDLKPKFELNFFFIFFFMYNNHCSTLQRKRQNVRFQLGVKGLRGIRTRREKEEASRGSRATPSDVVGGWSLFHNFNP